MPASYVGATRPGRGGSGVGVHVPISGDSKGLEAAIRQATSALQGFGKNISGMGQIMAAAFSVSAITDFAAESVKLAATMEGVTEAFDRLANADYLRKLQQATRGTVNNLELMRQTVRANNFQIPLQQLPTLFEFAAKRAAQTGESVDYLVESIILGIGRKSPLILDNLGISAVRLREKLRGVGVETASVADIARIMGEIIDDEMGKMGEVTLTSAQKMQRLGASFDNFKMTIGALIIDTGLIDWFDKLAFYIDRLNYTLKDSSLEGFVKNWALIVRSPLAGVINGLKKFVTGANEASRAEAEMEARMWGLEQALKGDKQEIEEMTMSLANSGMPVKEAYTKATELLILQLIREREEVYDNADAYDAYTKRIEALRQQKESATVTTIATLEEELKALIEKRDNENIANLQVINDYNEQIRLLQEKIKKLKGEVDVTKDLEKARKDARKADQDSMKVITDNISAKTWSDVKAANAFGSFASPDDVERMKQIGDLMLWVGQQYMTGGQYILETNKELDLSFRTTWIDALAEMEKTAEEMTQNTIMLFEQLGSAVGSAMGQMVGALVKGELTLEEALIGMVASIIQSAFQIIAAYMAESAASAFASGAAAGGPAAPITGAALAMATIAAFMATVPAVAMAQGGIVPMGFPGDTYPAMLSSGEAVIPPHKLDSIMGGGQVVVLDTIIRGEDIYLIQQKQATKNARYK